ncbi:MAG: MFS transporter [Chloroflexi bacterium]|nr:MFS transporter [Chloroflexota bacterium]
MNRKWWVLAAVGIGTFMSALDGSVVNIVLPVVSQEFKTNVATVEWVVTIYLLVLSGLLLTFGRLGDLRGHKSIYVAGFVLFVAGSALCGLAPNELSLVAFRALQAIGAAMLLSNSAAILTKNFPAEQRGQALGMQATMTYLGLTVGPSLGGWLTTAFGWRAVFYINVPVGIVAVVLSLAVVPPERGEEGAERFDAAGAVAFLLGLVLVLLALNQGGEWGWTSPLILGIAAVGLIALVAFVAVEQHFSAPMLDLSLFRRRLFSASVASAVLNYVCLYSVIFLMPFYLIQGRGFSAAHAGLLLTAQPLVMAISAPVSGTLSDRIGGRIPGTIGMTILAAGLFLLARLGPASSEIYIVFVLAIIGLGIGIFISPNSSALMGSAPRNRQGIASGVLATARYAGMVLGVGLAGAIFTTVQSFDPAGGAGAGLFNGVEAGWLVAAGIAALGILTSAARGTGTPLRVESSD